MSLSLEKTQISRDFS